MGYKKLTDDEIVEALLRESPEYLTDLCNDKVLCEKYPFIEGHFNLGLFIGAKWMQNRVYQQLLVEQACEDFKKRSDALREAIFDWGDLEAQYNTMHYMKFIVSFEETLNHISASLARLGMKGRLTYHNVFGDITFRI